MNLDFSMKIDIWSYHINRPIMFMNWRKISKATETINGKGEKQRLKEKGHNFYQWLMGGGGGWLTLSLTAHLMLLISLQSYKLAPLKRRHYANWRRFWWCNGGRFVTCHIYCVNTPQSFEFLFSTVWHVGQWQKLLSSRPTPANQMPA